VEFPKRTTSSDDFIYSVLVFIFFSYRAENIHHLHWFFEGSGAVFHAAWNDVYFARLEYLHFPGHIELDVPFDHNAYLFVGMAVAGKFGVRFQVDHGHQHLLAPKSPGYDPGEQFFGLSLIWVVEIHGMHSFIERDGGTDLSKHSSKVPAQGTRY
jgi:hypothetical protein